MQIAIVLYPGFTALDFIGPYEVLRNLPDTEVRFLWHEPGPIAADSGVLIVGATHSFDETPSPDVLLVPGGMTTFEHARDEKLLDWVRRAQRDRDVDGVGVLRLGDPGRRRPARGQARDVALDGGADAEGVRRDAGRATSGSCHGTATRIVTCAGVSAGIDLGLWLAGADRRRGQGQGHPAGHRVRPAAAVRLRAHVQGVGGHQGAATALMSPGSDEAHPAQGHHAGAVGAGHPRGPQEARLRRADARHRDLRTSTRAERGSACRNRCQVGSAG